MASSTTALLLLATIIATATTTTTSARPCKTIFFITSSSHHHHHNPHRLTFFFTQIPKFPSTAPLPRPTPMLLDQSIITSSSSSSSSSLSSSSSSDVASSERYYSASIRERTMDIMSIVGAVLFGVGCGALTAATMYLFWSLFVPRRFEFCSDDDDSGDEESNHEGYAAVASATKEVPPSADEIDRIAAMK